METKKAIQFIILFAISYIILNGLYQYILWIYAPQPDVLTVYTSAIFCNIFNQFTPTPLLTDAAILISHNQKKLVRIAEGCNGMAVITTFLSFAIAFKSNFKNYLFFIPLAVLSILIINILRLYLLIEIKLVYNNYFDIFHTYIFPAIIYFITFLLMVLWVKFINRKTGNES
ncbi:MAG: exosortase family protein XrtF [Candidatus Methylacidiphilales bacterium]